MRQFACLLLIASLLGQRAALPHSHAGSGIAEPQGHALRPHIHLSHKHHLSDKHQGGRAAHSHDEHDRGHSHAHHQSDYRNEASHDGIANWQNSPPSDHDADAVYLDAGNNVGLVQTTIQSPTPDGLFLVICTTTLHGAPALRQTWAPPRYGAHVPVFLASTKLVV